MTMQTRTIYTGLGAVEYVDVIVPRLDGQVSYEFAFGGVHSAGTWQAATVVEPLNATQTRVRTMVGQGHYDPAQGLYRKWWRSTQGEVVEVHREDLYDTVSIVTDTGEGIGDGGDNENAADIAALQADLAAEQQARTDGDVALGAEIDTETQARIDGDAALQAAIDALPADGGGTPAAPTFVTQDGPTVQLGLGLTFVTVTDDVELELPADPTPGDVVQVRLIAYFPDGDKTTARNFVFTPTPVVMDLLASTSLQGDLDNGYATISLLDRNFNYVNEQAGWVDFGLHYGYQQKKTVPPPPPTPPAPSPADVVIEPYQDGYRLTTLPRATGWTYVVRSNSSSHATYYYDKYQHDGPGVIVGDYVLAAGTEVTFSAQWQLDSDGTPSTDWVDVATITVGETPFVTPTNIVVGTSSSEVPNPDDPTSVAATFRITCDNPPVTSDGHTWQRPLTFQTDFYEAGVWSGDVGVVLPDESGVYAFSLYTSADALPKTCQVRVRQGSMVHFDDGTTQQMASPTVEQSPNSEPFTVTLVAPA